MTIKYSPYDESLWSNPWPIYRQMQEESPAYYIEELDCWALSRFEDIWQASMDRHCFTATHGTSPDALFLSEDLPPQVFLFMDLPEHGKHRNLIGRSYLKNKIALIDDHVRSVVKEQLREGMEEGQFDVYRVASRTALELIAAFIGLEVEEVLYIRTLIDQFYLREPRVRGTTDKGKKAFGLAQDFIQKLISKYRKSPPAEHSHIYTWLNAMIDDRSLSDEQIFYSIFAMVVTGSDTLPLATAGCIYYLDTYPDQYHLLRDDMTLAGAAFEEAARFDQPTNMLGRYIAKDTELHGCTMEIGQSVLFLYAAACRDQAEFDRADRFLIQRQQRRNLTFGTGLHFCLGQHLARLEGKILIEEIMANIPDYEVDRSACQRIYGEFLQGFKSVPLKFKPQ